LTIYEKLKLRNVELLSHFGGNALESAGNPKKADHGGVNSSQQMKNDSIF